MTLTRDEALRVICTVAEARYERVDIPAAIAHALAAATPSDQPMVFEAIGVLTGCPSGEFIDVPRPPGGGA